MRPTPVLTVLAATLFASAAVAQDLQTSNDWATGAAHGAVIDSINRENVRRLRGERRHTGQRSTTNSSNSRWTPAERQKNCAFVRAHLHRLNAKQLHSYQMACRGT